MGGAAGTAGTPATTPRARPARPPAAGRRPGAGIFCPGVGRGPGLLR